MIELTHRCNWRCVFCYNSKSPPAAELSPEEWGQVLDDLRRLGTLSVTLTGGDPLLYPGFLSVAAAVRQRRFALRIFTNGSLIDPSMGEAIAALLPLSVAISLHGACAPTHDRVTGRPGSFDAMLRGVEELRRRGVRLVLRTPLSRLNEREIDGMVALAAKLGVAYRMDPRLTPRDDGDRTPLSYGATAAGVRRMCELLAAEGRVPAVDRQPGGTNCGVGRLTLAVDPTGNVYPCLAWKQACLGNVRSRRLAELWMASAEREGPAEIARVAHETIRLLPGMASKVAFCPALAQQVSGDPFATDTMHDTLAAALATVVER
jgi:MoaA/NifB/PqqE/SkfB family radical SAM enzyme